MWQNRPAYAPVMQSRPVVPMPRTSARYPLRLASIPYRDVVLAPPLMSRDKPGTLVDPSAVYPCGSYEAYLEAKKRRQRKKKKEDESKSSDTSSQSGPDERERKEMPRSYFYKALKLPSGRLVDIRYRNKYIRKWARKEAGGEPCQICCAVFIILLLLTILYVYLSNQGWFFSAIAALTPKHSSQAPLDQKSAESTTPFTDTAQEDDESSTVEGFSATVIDVTFDSSRDSSVSDAAAEEARLMSRATEQFEARSINKTTA